MLKIMISQPMFNKTNEEIQSERGKVIKKMKADGLKLEYVDTIIKEEAPEDSNSGMWYLAKSIEMMSKVDVVYFMKGWEKARGCKIEREVAHDYKIKILDTNFLEEEVTIKR